MAALVIAEQDHASIKPATLNTVTAAIACGGDVHVLVAGANAAEAGKAAAQISGVAKVIVADSPSLAENLAENVAAQALAIASNYSHILFPSTANGKTARAVSSWQVRCKTGFRRLTRPRHKRESLHTSSSTRAQGDITIGAIGTQGAAPLAIAVMTGELDLAVLEAKPCSICHFLHLRQLFKRSRR
jgi:electron transfer flavoprotein alpha subunit